MNTTVLDFTLSLLILDGLKYAHEPPNGWRLRSAPEGVPFDFAQDKLPERGTRWWAGRDNVILTEPTSSRANCLKTRRLGEGAIRCDHTCPRSEADGIAHPGALCRGSGARRRHRARRVSRVAGLCWAFLIITQKTHRKSTLPMFRRYQMFRSSDSLIGLGSDQQVEADCSHSWSPL